MAKPLIWSPRAAREFFEILDWIAKSSPGYSTSIGDRIEARVARLPDNPKQGRRVPEYDGEREFREVFVHRWRLIYEIREAEIVFVTIVHGARSIGNVEPF